MKDLCVNRATVVTNNTVDHIEEVEHLQEDIIKTLAYRSTDIKARSRGNKIIKYNNIERLRVKSNRELILRFLQDELDVDIEEMCIERAQRWISENRGKTGYN